MSIDKSKVKSGDQIKVKINDWLTSDWQTVKTSLYGDLIVGDSVYNLNSINLEVIAHRPNLESFKQAVKAAQDKVKAAEEEVRQAVKALKEAENPKPGLGAKVKIISSEHVYFGSYGTVVDRPEVAFSPESSHRVWVKIAESFSPLHYPISAVKEVF